MRKKVSALLLKRLHHSGSPQHPVFSAQRAGKRGGGIRRRRISGFKMELASLPSRSFVTCEYASPQSVGWRFDLLNVMRMNWRGLSGLLTVLSQNLVFLASIYEFIFTLTSPFFGVSC